MSSEAKLAFSFLNFSNLRALMWYWQVDDELARMKANMLPPSDNGKQLNPGSSSAAVDDELEKMRREMNK